MTTTFLKPSDTANNWYVISAKDQIVGRIATRIAKALMGKTKANFTPNVDNGDYVIVTDADQVTLSGTKTSRKVYRFHTGYMGGLKEVPFTRLRSDHPEKIIYLAVKRMMPKTILSKHMLTKLKVYRGAAHPHIAQQPKPLP